MHSLAIVQWKYVPNSCMNRELSAMSVMSSTVSSVLQCSVLREYRCHEQYESMGSAAFERVIQKTIT